MTTEMLSVLLDTYILLWWQSDASSLSKAQAQVLREWGYSLHSGSPNGQWMLLYFSIDRLGSFAVRSN